MEGEIIYALEALFSPAFTIEATCSSGFGFALEAQAGGRTRKRAGCLPAWRGWHFERQNCFEKGTLTKIFVQYVRRTLIVIMVDTPKVKKATKPKAKPAHPKTTVMVVEAIKALKDRKGSSLPAIKKYIAANYKVDTVKLAPFIKKAVKSLVEKKVLLQVKGTGASGSFKVSAAAKAEKKPKKAAAKKPKAKKPKTPKKKAVKKAKTPKKTAAAKKPKSPKKAAAKKPAAKKPAAKKPAAKKPAAKKPAAKAKKAK